MYYSLDSSINSISYLYDCIKLCMRMSRIFYIFTTSYTGFYITNLSNKYTYKIQPNPRLELIKSITTKIEDMNIVYVKIFQSLCLDDKLLNEDEKEYLTKYTDRVPYMESDIDYAMLDTLETNYNIKLDSYTPLNSGVISVVYTGMYNNEKVVIKVLKNNINHRLSIAFEDMEFILNMAYVFPIIRKLNLKKCLLDNKEILMEQTNFIREANNIETFKSKFENHSEYIIPYCYKDITMAYNNVIVMENIKNLVYNDIKNYDEIVKNEFGKLIGKFGLICLLFISAIHCDLHSGNIFFYINDDYDDDKPKYQLGIIDFGIVAYPSRENQNIYYNYFKNIQMDKDRSKIKEHIVGIINEKIKFQNLELSKKTQLLKELEEIMLGETTSQKDHQRVVFMNMSKCINNYGFSYTKEFNQITLSMAVSSNMALNLIIDSEKTQNEIMQSFNQINSLIDI